MLRAIAAAKFSKTSHHQNPAKTPRTSPKNKTP